MKIEEQVLSIEQMKRLQELGVDTSDASMCWVAEGYAYTDEGQWKLCIPNHFLLPYNIPTYTIGDLIEKLPKNIDLGFGEYDLEMSTKGEYVEVQYENDYDDYTPFFCSNLSLIESLYSILCWLAENHKELLEVKK